MDEKHMTKISEAAKIRACELANAERPPNLLFKSVPEDIDLDYHLTALARVLQEHSDVAKDIEPSLMPDHYDPRIKDANNKLRALILPDDPDPVDALADELFDGFAIGAGHHKRRLIAALAKHGLNIIKQD
jgi:hypothetical protein